MRFLHNPVNFDLTYSDVFFVPGYSDIASRFEVDIKSPDEVGINTPVLVANMNAVAGKRMAETVARRGGLAVLPQDIPMDVLENMIKYIKSRHLIYETALTLGPDNTVAEALNIIHKRSHDTVVIVDTKQSPVGIFKEKDASGYDRFTPLSQVMSTELVTIPAGWKPERTYEFLSRRLIDAAPVVEKGKLAGIMTKKGALRSSMYTPLVDKQNRLKVAVAIGINGDVAAKAAQVLKIGADVIVVDTAHGHQRKMVQAIKAVRSVDKKIPLVAGNVVTAQATKDLAQAGADIIKVGVGPGAMCTTRMMTGVGRPQFSAVLECAAAARELGKNVWADGGIRYPRDVALALAAGASSVMFGSWWAGTFESAGDVLRDNEGRLYKENYGMASKRAVKNRGGGGNSFEQAKRELFEEGISKGIPYINPERPGAEDLIDYIVAGLRSSMSYAGARNITEFQDKAVVGVQSASGYQEGRAVETNWD
jgi:IMP dehydrogenase